MRWSVVLCTLPIVAALLPSAVLAQEPEKLRERLKVERVRVGLPDGRGNDGGGRMKAGFWLPIYIDLAIGPQDIASGEAVLEVETTDSDGVQNRLTQGLTQVLPKNQTISSIITYARPANLNSEIALTIRLSGRVYKKVPAQADYQGFADTGGVLYLTLGSKLPGLQRALLTRPQQGGGQPGDENVDDDFGQNRLRRFAAIDSVELMPTRWYGYHAVDVLVLTTGSEAFLRALLADRSGRLDALTEWVRRGGRMIVTAGHNQQLIGTVLTRMQLLNCSITGTVTRPGLSTLQAMTAQRIRFQPADGVEIAKLAPGPGADVLEELREPASDRDREARPLGIQSACGMGRVLLVGLDLDSPPFTAWQGQADFWRTLMDKVQPRQSDPQVQQFQPFGMRSESGELAADMQANGLEKFGDITVISFGWVALFILLYIIVVGPLDYLFLKKVVKRLELTWITFPAVVIVISAAAYFTAYYLKGNDLKINKIDVVDIDLSPAVDSQNPPPRVFGTTWFTLFSPRIQHYTIGVEPAENWGASGGKEPPATMVGWLGKPTDQWGGMGRGGSQSLFRRTYEYTDDLSGLIGVPIQVWATKSFTASWVVPSAGTVVPFSAELKHAPGRADMLIGTVTNLLPVELQDVVLFYRGNSFPLPQGTLTPGVPVRINLGNGMGGLNPWFSSRFTDPPRPDSSKPYELEWASGPGMKTLLFYDRAGDRNVRNTTLRQIDQGWRLKDREEVVLLGRVSPAAGEGAAEKITQDGVSASRLWLGELPGTGKTRPALVGTMTQRTIVRVYIPVNPQAQ
jgi:hypothetical protein